MARRVRAKGLSVPILFLTARDAVSDRVGGFEAGGDDYLVKPFAMAELLVRVRALLRRGVIVEDMLSYRDLTLDPVLRRALRAGREIDLTQRESALLELLIRNAGVVVSRSPALAERLGRQWRRFERRRSLHLLSAPEARRSTADRDRARRRFSPSAMKLTLRARVVLAACASILVAVALLAVGVSVLVENQLRSSLDRSLRDRAAEVARLSVSAPALLTAPGALDSSIGGQQLSIEVLDRHGRVLARSLALGGSLLPARLVGRVIADGRAEYADDRLGDRPLRLYVAPLPAATGAASGVPCRGGHDRGDRRDARSAASVRGACRRSWPPRSPASSRSCSSAGRCARSSGSPPGPRRWSERATPRGGCPSRTRVTRSDGSRRR